MEDLEGLEKFLIEHSKINPMFIKDFFGFQKKQKFKHYYPFEIDLEDIVYWLETKKGHLKDTLKLSYRKDIDYIVLFPPIRKSHIASKKELILLTSDCFKNICMRSRTKKANEVRKYYIELEYLLSKYKNYIIEGQKSKINVLQSNLKVEKYSKGNFIYIFEDIDELGEKYYRIGRSSDLEKRMKMHNSSSTHKKNVVYKIKTNNPVHFEKCLQSILFNFRYKDKKDFYKIQKSYIPKAIKICKNIVELFKKID